MRLRRHNLVAAIGIIFCLGQSDIGVCSGKMGPIKLTISDLNILHESLAVARDLCKRYPTTEEGLAIFNKRSPAWKCLETHSWKLIWDMSYTFTHGTDGWGKKFKYVSDGASYRIDASYGYFVTDKTPMRSGGGYWENPHPLPPDPEPNIKDTVPTR